jgi:hypothetical protein
LGSSRLSDFWDLVGREGLLSACRGSARYCTYLRDRPIPFRGLHKILKLKTNQYSVNSLFRSIRRAPNEYRHFSYRTTFLSRNALLTKNNVVSASHPNLSKRFYCQNRLLFKPSDEIFKCSFQMNIY